MERDKSIQLRHPYTGNMKKGYYGFSRDSFWSAGLVWIHRNPASCLDYTGTLLGTVIGFGAFFVVPFLTTEIEGVSLTVGNVEISARAIMGIGGLFTFFIQNSVIALICNRRNTLQLLEKGYRILPGVNKQEARKALRLEEADAPR